MVLAPISKSSSRGVPIVPHKADLARPGEREGSETRCQTIMAGRSAIANRREVSHRVRPSAGDEPWIAHGLRRFHTATCSDMGKQPITFM